MAWKEKLSSVKIQLISSNYIVSQKLHPHYYCNNKSNVHKTLIPGMNQAINWRYMRLQWVGGSVSRLKHYFWQDSQWHYLQLFCSYSLVTLYFYSVVLQYFSIRLSLYLFAFLLTYLFSYTQGLHAAYAYYHGCYPGSMYIAERGGFQQSHS